MQPGHNSTQSHKQQAHIQEQEKSILTTIELPQTKRRGRTKAEEMASALENQDKGEQDRDVTMSDYGDGTPSKNPNLAKGLFLSKNQTCLTYQKHNAREGRWTPGNTIRLLHKTVHIKVNINEGIYFDMAKVGPAVNAPKSKEVSKGMSTVAVGMCNDAVTPRYHMSKEGIKKWKNRSGNIARLRLSHTKGKYDICNSTGLLVEQTNINYYPKYDSREKQDIKAMDMWSLYESSRKDNVLWYERKMKDWRKARRQWEISLCHEAR
ncbi:MAG: hypothetical protein FRX48_09765 [Lasallia pustulata]|uniref:Uncharacterized protein n=1 Tax=Lasallia pustulata TaxID=136370 RepID=A0A5M8PC33_9LECA|nr:MAG: hypothetical protein FRX48_09765 [Lasallia pustulata]